jgi:hypothetical protein
MDGPHIAQALASGPQSGDGQGAGRATGAASGATGGSEEAASNLASGSGSLQVEASVVLSSSGRAVVYEMFEALSVTADGAILRGGLLLEVNEEVTLELRMADLSAFRARARVVEIQQGERPAMRVVWTRVSDADRHRLHR